MSKAINDGGPAFPDAEGQADYTGGMTLRDYFAGQALVGMLSSEATADQIGVDLKQATCIAAYTWSDAMIEARERRPE